ncbi:alpha/beta fold hydrolase [Allokutzneria albata]|uniref:Pimeloyl-ACP methyl ester carboxylesterase n=1 Tax=Allokutzneria albata TaxID=211114 RepID=A0A1G9YVA6_ALLAB|nr:alpha/beta hydrolase [Allokutzneria albata]SDN12293.1 Pimeloyl-ACP methyl ester carboxylesterase [Allokutzneria albata]
MSEGVLPGGLPYFTAGEGRPLVYLPGFNPSHHNPSPTGRKMLARTMRPFVAAGRKVYFVNRKPGMRLGSTMSDVADDHAKALHEYFREPVDVIGHSTGGSIALQLIVDHPEVVRRGVVASTAYALGPVAKGAQLEMARRLAQGRPGYHLLVPGMVKHRVPRAVLGGLLWAVGLVLPKPKDPSDMLAMMTAEDGFDVYDRLPRVTTPTLVICGARDHFWTPEMFAETAARMPGGTLVMYPGAGHGVITKREYHRDVLAFLR